MNIVFLFCLFVILLLGPSFTLSSPVQDLELVVHEVHKSINASRRQLSFLSCGMGNPIDDCWRCDKNWEKNRQRLAYCAVGFGKNAIGGRNGDIYSLTTLENALFKGCQGDYKSNVCRHGYFHVVNNDYTHWEMYAIGGSAAPTINSQGNRFLAPNGQFDKEVAKHEDAPEDEWRGWNWRSEGDLMLNSAFFTTSGEGA